MRLTASECDYFQSSHDSLPLAEFIFVALANECVHYIVLLLSSSQRDVIKTGFPETNAGNHVTDPKAAVPRPRPRPSKIAVNGIEVDTGPQS